MEESLLTGTYSKDLLSFPKVSISFSQRSSKEPSQRQEARAHLQAASASKDASEARWAYPHRPQQQRPQDPVLHPEEDAWPQVSLLGSGESCGVLCQE